VKGLESLGLAVFAIVWAISTFCSLRARVGKIDLAATDVLDSFIYDVICQFEA
jgi:hypothetical protein